MVAQSKKPKAPKAKAAKIPRPKALSKAAKPAPGGLETKSAEYKAESIKVLKGLDAVR